MRRIVHPTDFSAASRPAFAKAVALAKRDRAELLIAHVLAPMVPMMDGYVSGDIYTEVEEANRRYGKKHLDALVAKARTAGVRARGLLLEGVAHDAIVRAARGAEMIVMGTHGRTGIARVVLGSVASRVVSHAKCPVLTVRGRG
jgi:nucleotide-binding universal stress UspA family protein